MISKVRELDYTDIRAKIDELCVSNMFFSEDTVKLMKEIVPEYVSNNSKNCELDKEIKHFSKSTPEPSIKKVQGSLTQ